MKKILMLIIAIIMAVGVKTQVKFEKLIPQNAESCEIYIAGQIDSQEDWNCIYTNNMTIMSGNLENVGIKNNINGNILGIAVTYKHDSASVDTILQSLQAKIVKTQKLDDMIIYYAYSGLLGGGVKIDGTKINVQIAYSSSGIKVATPLIMGSY